MCGSQGLVETLLYVLVQKKVRSSINVDLFTQALVDTLISV